MIVCVCRAVSDYEIVRALHRGEISNLFKEKSPGSVCGSCVPEILDIIEANKEDEHSSEND